MKFLVEYRPLALEDLYELRAYITCKEDALIAQNQIRRIRDHVRALDIMPERYPRVDFEPWASRGVRKLGIGNYIAYYEIDTERRIVSVIGVIHTKRDIRNIADIR